MSAGDRDTLAATGGIVVVLLEHRYTYGDYGGGWTICRCGFQPPEPPRNASEEHRVHLARVIASSDWLREQRTEAWKAGHGWCDDGDLGCDHEPFTPNPYLED